MKDSFTEEVDCQVQYVNKTEGEYLMTLYEKLQAERIEGIEQGVTKEKKQSVLRYFQLGLSVEQIAKGSDLPIEEVQKILKEIGN